MRFLLSDLDGVILKKEYYFSDRFCEKYGVPKEVVQDFFKNEFQQCLVGQADLREVLSVKLVEWGIDESVDTILSFWFEHERTLDESVLEKVKMLRESGVRVYISTNNEKLRAQYVWDVLGFKKSFDGIFASGEVGFKKPTEAFWKHVWQALALTDVLAEKSDVEVWDDDMQNCEGAQQFGFNALFHEK
jgi:putative hydrolase of the HAD superfamily